MTQRYTSSPTPSIQQMKSATLNKARRKFCRTASLALFLVVSLLAFFSCSQYQAVSEEGDRYHLEEYGAVGDGTTDNTALLNEMLMNVQDTGARIIVPAGRFLTGDITIPEQATLIFRSGAELVVREDAVLTINGTIDANIEQIFSGEGSVAGAPKNLQVYPQWFGAVGDGEHNDAPAIQKAADLAASSLGSTLFIPDGEYLFLEDLNFRSNITSQGLLIKEIEIDEDRTRFSNFTFVPTHYPKNNPHINFVADHEEVELEAEPFLGVQEGAFQLPAYQNVPLADGSGTVDLMQGGTIRFYSTDFFSSRNNQKGDQYYDRNDISQIVSGRGDIFPELAFSYEEPAGAPRWSPTANYVKGDYVSWDGELYKATWPTGPGSVFEDRYLGSVDVGPVQPDAEEMTTRYEFVFDDGSEDALTIWRQVAAQVFYREKDRPLTVNGLRVEVRLVNHDGRAKRISGGAVNVRRSNMTFNNLEITVRDRDATLGRLLNSSGVVNLEFNKGYFSGATYHGLGYNILNMNVANVRYYNTISVNSRKGLDGRHGKNITIQGGHYSVIDDHYGRNYVIRDIVMSGRSTLIPGYVTPDADLQEWRFQTIRAIGFAGANLRVENVTINQHDSRPPQERTTDDQLYGAIGGVISVRSDIGDLYGTIILRDIDVVGNMENVRIFNHTIDPEFDYAREIRVPGKMILEDIQLQGGGNVQMEIGKGFNPGSYGPIEVRGIQSISKVYSTSESLLFSNCSFQDAEFEVDADVSITFRHCEFYGENKGLNRSDMRSASENLQATGAEVSFPLEFRNPSLYRE